MEEKTLYDVHLHAFNLSHPSISAFVWRLVHDLPRTLSPDGPWKCEDGYNALV